MLSRIAKPCKPFLVKLAGFFQTLLAVTAKASFVEALNRPAMLPTASEFLKLVSVVILASGSGKGDDQRDHGEE